MAVLMMQRTRQRDAGFTLLELVLVMLLIVIAVGIVAPKLAGWNRGQELRNSAETFISLTRLARSQAITNSAVYRIEFKAEEGKFQLKKQQRATTGTPSQFTAVDTSMGKEFSVPAGGKILLTVTLDSQQQGDMLECINFYPNGRTQKATVLISDKTGNKIQASCESPTEEFTVKQVDKSS